MNIGNPFILLSMVNMKLRDTSLTVADVAADLDASEEELREVLSDIGFTYSESSRQFGVLGHFFVADYVSFPVVDCHMLVFLRSVAISRCNISGIF